MISYGSIEPIGRNYERLQRTPKIIQSDINFDDFRKPAIKEVKHQKNPIDTHERGLKIHTDERVIRQQKARKPTQKSNPDCDSANSDSSFHGQSKHKIIKLVPNDRPKRGAAVIAQLKTRECFTFNYSSHDPHETIENKLENQNNVQIRMEPASKTILNDMEKKYCSPKFNTLKRCPSHSTSEGTIENPRQRKRRRKKDATPNPTVDIVPIQDTNKHNMHLHSKAKVVNTSNNKPIQYQTKPSSHITHDRETPDMPVEWNLRYGNKLWCFVTNKPV